MEPNPYTFCKENPRLAVTNCEKSPYVMLAAGAIFLMSMRSYNRRFFRKDGNILNLMGFTAMSAPAAYVYGDSMFGSAGTDAGIMNNNLENTH